MKVQLTLTINVSNDLINENDDDEKRWLFDYVLNYNSSNYHLISDEIGDTLDIESINKIKVINP